MALGAVADALGLSLPAISRAVDGLVQRGLVKREEDPRDRRSKLVTATAAGARTFERLTRTATCRASATSSPSSSPRTDSAAGARDRPLLDAL